MYSSAKLPEVADNALKRRIADEAWATMVSKTNSALRNRGLILYFWVAAMMDCGLLKDGSYKDNDFFPQASIRVMPYTQADLLSGCSDMKSGKASTMKPAVLAGHAVPRNTTVVSHEEKELKAKHPEGRHKSYPHPKALDHVVRRTIWRGAIVQTVIWSVQGLRGLFAG